MSDDGSMAAIAQSAAQDLAMITNGPSSYFYETGFCSFGFNNAVTNGWTGLQFGITSDKDVSLSVNLQTGTVTVACSSFTNKYLTISVPVGITQYQIPFSSFPNANLNNIMSVSFESPTPAGTLSFSPLFFYC